MGFFIYLYFLWLWLCLLLWVVWIVHVKDFKHNIRVFSCTPDVEVAVDASRCKILVLLFLSSKRYNLSNLAIVNLVRDMVLVHLLKTKHYERVITVSRYQEVKVFSCNGHGMEFMMSFDGVPASLHVLVPDLETFVL